MAITPDNADADCRIGEPAPRHADTVWHHDLGKIPGGERCLECGAMFRDKTERRKNSSLPPQPIESTHRDPLPSDADDMGDGAGGVAKGGRDHG